MEVLDVFLHNFWSISSWIARNEYWNQYITQLRIRCYNTTFNFTVLSSILLWHALLLLTNIVDNISHFVKLVWTDIWAVGESKVYHIVAAMEISVAQFFASWAISQRKRTANFRLSNRLCGFLLLRFTYEDKCGKYMFISSNRIPK
jgi:hypothetical protein